MLVPFWLWFMETQWTRYPPDFYYSADVLSLDNFFDQRKNKFIGAQLSKTKFYYEVISANNSVNLIKNVFDVRKLTGENIFSVQRTYGIDPKTGKHLAGYGDRDRSGYLFAPPSLDKQDYTYWHINYNTPALMKFRQEVFIQGLKAFLYSCDYTADQTENLTYLSTVGETRGIKLNIHLQVWVEPLSGWMIKYEDKTAAYYYDLKSGHYLYPWNSFNNRYTNESISQQIALAKKEKQEIIFRKRIIPAFLLGLAVMLTWLSFLPFKKRNP